jgi:hypothetical protein
VGKGGTGTIFVDGKEVAKGRVEKTIASNRPWLVGTRLRFQDFVCIRPTGAL